MPRELKIVIRDTPTGRGATPWLEPQREKFTRVAKGCKEAFKDSKLKGAQKVQAMNRWMSHHLRQQE